jgi:hypothetical protein
MILTANHVLSINNDPFHLHVDLHDDIIYSTELEIKDPTECSTSAWHLYTLLKLDADNKLTTTFHHKRECPNSSNVNFPYECSNV